MLDEERFEKISSDLRQIKILLVALLLIVVTALVGLHNMLEFAGGAFVFAAVIVGVGYVVLLLAERIMRLNKPAQSDNQLQQEILRDFNEARKNGQDPTPDKQP